MDFNKLNSELYQLSAPHRFSKNPNDFDKGYLKMSNWLNDLCYYYEKKSEFKALIQAHKDKIDLLEQSLYKDGLIKLSMNYSCLEH